MREHITTRSIGRGRNAVWIRRTGERDAPRVIEIQANASFARLTLQQAKQLWAALADTISEIERPEETV